MFLGNSPGMSIEPAILLLFIMATALASALKVTADTASFVGGVEQKWMVDLHCSCLLKDIRHCSEIFANINLAE